MSQPDLPDGFDWPDLTREWWAAWGEDPRTKNCTLVDWLYLRDGAVLHAEVWSTGAGDRVGDLRNHVKVFEARLEELAKNTPRERETVLDDLAKRRAARGARASG